MEEALLDLGRANERLAAHSNDGCGKAPRGAASAAVAADSAALLAELAMRSRTSCGGSSPCGSPVARGSPSSARETQVCTAPSPPALPA